MLLVRSCYRFFCVRDDNPSRSWTSTYRDTQQPVIRFRFLIMQTETSSTDSGRWDRLATDILDQQPITHEQAVEVLRAPDEELLDIMSAAYRIRRRYFGNTVQLYFLMNAKSGLCPEDCSYCSQSRISSSEIPRHNLLSREKLLEGARAAVSRKSKTYCIVISARGPNERELAAVEEIVPEIKSLYGLKICACLGLLSREQARRLKACGVDRVNHNVN